MVFNTLMPRQNCRHFPDDIFKRMFFDQNVSISVKITFKFAPKGLINIPSLVQIMAWRRPVDKSLFEPMALSLPTQVSLGRNELMQLWRYTGNDCPYHRCQGQRMSIISHQRVWIITGTSKIYAWKTAETLAKWFGHLLARYSLTLDN